MDSLLNGHYFSPEIKPISAKQIEKYLAEIGPVWTINTENNSIEASFNFKNYYETMAFTNAVAWIAHQRDHHPEIRLTYDCCHISYKTHSINALSENDFVCAALINQIKIT
jgi:4a-hydroxytetrahydrobiopterin dehydratase